MSSGSSIQFLHSNNVPERDSIQTRSNPFLITSETDSMDYSISSTMSSSSLENGMLICDHFDRPLSHCDKMWQVEDLSKAVKECKLKVLSLVDDTDSKDKYIERLIELNEALHTAKERQKLESSDRPVINIRSKDSATAIAGHTLMKYRYGLSALRYCEVCHGTLKTTRSVYRCKDCLVHIHSSMACLQGLHRACPAADREHPSMLSSQMISRRRFSSSDYGFHIDIDSFPIPGSLSSQKFLCAECSYPLKPISCIEGESSPSRSPPKFCHYYRKFYCSKCHWGDKYIIPSVYFLLNKWKKMSVCRSAYIKLSYVWDKALFRMPSFWETGLPEVLSVLSLRKRLLPLRNFVYSCQSLRKITESFPSWLIDQPYLITMKLAQDICDGTASQTVQVLYSAIIAHIPQCDICQRLCRPCHLCDDPEILYIVSSTVWTCGLCFLTCVHEKCGLQKYREKAEYICDNCSRA